MGNTLKKIIDRCSCNSSCNIQVEKDLKEIKNFFKQLNIEDLIHLKEYMENSQKITMV